MDLKMQLLKFGIIVICYMGTVLMARDIMEFSQYTFTWEDAEARCTRQGHVLVPGRRYRAKAIMKWMDKEHVESVWLNGWRSVSDIMPDANNKLKALKVDFSRLQSKDTKMVCQLDTAFYDPLYKAKSPEEARTVCAKDGASLAGINTVGDVQEVTESILADTPHWVNSISSQSSKVKQCLVAKKVGDQLKYVYDDCSKEYSFICLKDANLIASFSPLISLKLARYDEFEEEIEKLEQSMVSSTEIYEPFSSIDLFPAFTSIEMIQTTSTVSSSTTSTDTSSVSTTIKASDKLASTPTAVITSDIPAVMSTKRQPEETSSSQLLDVSASKTVEVSAVDKISSTSISETPVLITKKAFDIDKTASDDFFETSLKVTIQNTDSFEQTKLTKSVFSSTVSLAVTTTSIPGMTSSHTPSPSIESSQDFESGKIISTSETLQDETSIETSTDIVVIHPYSISRGGNHMPSLSVESSQNVESVKTISTSETLQEETSIETSADIVVIPSYSISEGGPMSQTDTLALNPVMTKQVVDNSIDLVEIQDSESLYIDETKAQLQPTDSKTAHDESHYQISSLTESKSQDIQTIQRSSVVTGEIQLIPNTQEQSIEPTATGIYLSSSSTREDTQGFILSSILHGELETDDLSQLVEPTSSETPVYKTETQTSAVPLTNVSEHMMPAVIDTLTFVFEETQSQSVHKMPKLSVSSTESSKYMEQDVSTVLIYTSEGIVPELMSTYNSEDSKTMTEYLVPTFSTLSAYMSKETKTYISPTVTKSSMYTDILQSTVSSEEDLMTDLSSSQDTVNDEFSYYVDISHSSEIANPETSAEMESLSSDDYIVTPFCPETSSATSSPSYDCVVIDSTSFCPETSSATSSPSYDCVVIDSTSFCPDTTSATDAPDSSTPVYRSSSITDVVMETSFSSPSSSSSVQYDMDKSSKSEEIYIHIPVLSTEAVMPSTPLYNLPDTTGDYEYDDAVDKDDVDDEIPGQIDKGKNEEDNEYGNETVDKGEVVGKKSEEDEEGIEAGLWVAFAILISLVLIALILALYLYRRRKLQKSKDITPANGAAAAGASSGETVELRDSPSRENGV